MESPTDITTGSTKELKILVEKVKEELGYKLKKLTNEDVINTNNQVSIKNLAKKIEALETYTNELNELYSFNQDMIINFRKRTNEIKNEIELLK